jgi:F-type H+-transporting ATPase subunit c
MIMKSTRTDDNSEEQITFQLNSSRRIFMESIGLGYLAAGIGAGVTVIGGGLGIGKLAAAAMEAMGRQPEAAGAIRGSMIVAAALIEGVTLFGLVICIILATKG